jgi:exosortase
VYDWIHLPDFSHGFLIPLISIFLIWKRGDQLDKMSVVPNNLGIILILTGLMLLILGNLASESFTMRFSFLLVFSGIVLFLLGWPQLKLLLFPIGFLIFMIPIPSFFLGKITFPLQLFASRVATLLLQLFEVPVLREGNIIHLADTSLEVAEACSGIRSLISLLALGTIFAYMSQKLIWKRTILILSCFLIAVIMNAARVSVTGVLAHTYGISVAEGFFHGFSGFILFAAAFALMVGTSFLLLRVK